MLENLNEANMFGAFTLDNALENVLQSFAWAAGFLECFG
jgi:hypothetical protein